MANRIYIAVGVLAILVFAAAFLIPALLDWNSYKPRMETMAREALGVPVTIEGDMDFTLLPQPRLHMEDVRMGEGERPLGRAGAVEADFSLMDFLRDRFAVTRLTLIEPTLNLTIGEDGALETPITLTESATASNVSIANARFAAGTLRLFDRRSGETWTVEAIDGTMGMDALRGPFTFEGGAAYEGTGYTVRLNSSAMNTQGVMQFGGLIRPRRGGFSVSATGLLSTGERPGYSGEFTYRQAPQAIAEAPNDEAVRGDLLIEGAVEADMDSLAVPEFMLMPDETQAATRLSGSAELMLGSERRFSAAIEGGVVSLDSQPASADRAAQIYPAIAMLRTMPAPPIPPLPGELSLAITELGLDAISLRQVRLSATTDGDVWTIGEFSGELPGETTVKLTGTLDQAAGWPTFEGTLALNATRLDALSRLWAPQSETNPLFGISGSLAGRVRLGQENLQLSRGRLVLDGTQNAVAASLDFGPNRRLAVSAQLSPLDPAQSAALAGLVPPVGSDTAFGSSFPRGSLDLTLESATFDGLSASEIEAHAAWEDGALAFDRLAVGDYGGLGFAGTARLAGTVAAPQISGEGTVRVAETAPALARLLGEPGAGVAGWQVVTQNLPARLDVTLEPPQDSGAQVLTADGRAAAADVQVTADLSGGVAALMAEPLSFALEADAQSGAALFEQVGMAPLITAEEGALLTVSGRGRLGGRLDADISIEGDGERVSYSGSLLLGDPSAIQGQGHTAFVITDMSTMMEAVGASGVYVPALDGEADLGFVGSESVTLSGLSATSEGREVTGNLTYAAQREGGLISGELAVAALDVETLAAAMGGGQAALIGAGDAVWPDGPLALGESARRTRGRIGITTPRIALGEPALLTDAAFELAWDDQEMRIGGLTGQMGGGTASFEASLCCAADFSAKSLTGRFGLTGVTLDSVLPEAPAAALEGTLTASGQFQGNGASYAELIASLAGNGSFAVNAFEAEGLSPDAFSEAAGIENLVEMAPDALETRVVDALDSGAFAAEQVGGVFSVTGGAVRISNLAIDGDEARLLGGGALDLATLDVSSDWTLATTEDLGGNGLITDTTGRIGARVAGPIRDPERTLDLTAMVDAIQMRAYELELEELERLRDEQEARQRQAAEEQAQRLEREAEQRAQDLLDQQDQEVRNLIEEGLEAQDEAGADAESETGTPDEGDADSDDADSGQDTAGEEPPAPLLTIPDQPLALPDNSGLDLNAP